MRTNLPARLAAPLLLLSLGLLMVGCAAAPTAANGSATPSQATSGSARPDEPVGTEPAPGGDEPGGDALRVEPQAGIRDPRPHAWDHIDIAADGRTLSVYYVGGVEDCYGLSEVRVDQGADGALRISVLEGSRPIVEGPCIDLGVFKVATVTLDEPLVLQGDEVRQ